MDIEPVEHYLYDINGLNFQNESILMKHVKVACPKAQANGRNNVQKSVSVCVCVCGKKQ